MRNLIRPAGVALLVFSVAASLVAGGRSPVAAQSTGGIFALSARGDGLGLEFIATGLPVIPQGKVAFISPASAQATLDQFSGSAFASAPYAGDLIVSLPSTVNGLGTGTLPAFPAYPFIVNTDSATTDARQEVGPYHIAAHSEPNASTADARIGLSTFAPQVASVTANASVTRDPDTGRLLAVATTHTAPFRVNDVLSIGDIRSTARFEYDPATPSKVPVKESSLSVGTLTIAGIELGITENGLTLAGQRLLPIDLSALAALLAGTGFSIEIIPAVETETAISSSAVELTYREDLPTPLLDTTMRVVLGRSSAALTTGTLPTVPALSAAPTIAPSTAPTVSPSVPVPALGDRAVPLAPVPEPPSTPASRPTPAPPLADFARLYLALVGAAFVALTSSRLTQWLSYRLNLAS